jgi:FtsH-binding integral membrane protein
MPRTTDGRLLTADRPAMNRSVSRCFFRSIALRLEWHFVSISHYGIRVRRRTVSYGYDTSFDQRMAIDAAASERLAFIRRTYLHVAGAVVAFAVLLAVLVSFVPPQVMQSLFFHGRFGWLIVLGAFMAVTFLAGRMAQSDMPVGAQYAGLGLYVVAEAAIFWPLVWICTTMPQFSGILPQAVILTLALAGGLTMSVFITKKDFSFMGPALWTLGWVALAVIFAGIIFGFNLGLWFSLAMIALMSGFILYETSRVMYHYNTNQHVAAALAIFASLATLLWYVIRALMAARR